jgi:hypothetical protein
MQFLLAWRWAAGAAVGVVDPGSLGEPGGCDLGGVSSPDLCRNCRDAAPGRTTRPMGTNDQDPEHGFGIQSRIPRDVRRLFFLLVQS